MDEELRKRQLGYQTNPGDTEAAGKYISFLEKRLALAGPEDLLRQAKKVHVLRAYETWQGQVDYDLEVEGDTYQQAAEKMALEFCEYDSLPHHGTITYSVYYSVQLPFEDKHLEFNSANISDIEHIEHPYRAAESIKKHPAYLAVKERDRKVAQDKKDAEEKARQELVRQQELAIYERIKRERES